MYVAEIVIGVGLLVLSGITFVAYQHPVRYAQYFFVYFFIGSLGSAVGIFIWNTALIFLLSFVPTPVSAGDGDIAFHRFKLTDSEQYIELSGANASSSRISVVIYSMNDNFLRTAYTMAQDIETITPYEVYFLQVPWESPISKTVVHAHGHRIGEMQTGTNIEFFRRDLSTLLTQAMSFLESIKNE